MELHSANELALAVREYRKQHKLSQQAIGELVGLKQATISAFENHPERSKLGTLFKILAATKLQLAIEPRSASLHTTCTWDESW